jgi:hypothetical protein
MRSGREYLEPGLTLDKRLLLSSKAQRQDSNLTFVHQRMLPADEEQRVGMLTLYGRILSGKAVADTDTAAFVSDLKLAGIVRAVKGQLKVRNRIYAHVFRAGWIDENMPGVELRRQRAAYLQGVWQAGALAAVVLLIIGSMAFAVVSQARRADKFATKEHLARIDADNNAKIAERTAYVANMNLIQREWETNNMAHVIELLEETRASEFRGFEWGYWNRLCHFELMTLKGHTDSINVVAFSPDGKRIVTGSLDKTAKVWDAGTGQEILSLNGNTSYLTSIAFSPDGKHIVTGCFQTAKVWDAMTGREMLTHQGHADNVRAVAFSVDGNCIATGSIDKTTRIWETLFN